MSNHPSEQDPFCLTVWVGLWFLSEPVSPWQESQKQYELEYQRRATNLDKCMAELWRMERARDKNAREMKVSSDCRKG